MVYGKLWRDRGWNGRVNHRESDLDNDILCSLGEYLRQLDVCDYGGNGEPAAGCADKRVEQRADLFWSKRHIDGCWWVGYYSKVADR